MRLERAATSGSLTGKFGLNLRFDLNGDSQWRCPTYPQATVPGVLRQTEIAEHRKSGDSAHQRISLVIAMLYGPICLKPLTP
jgi:hypothetical protein